jgi:hypothetical protein
MKMNILPIFSNNTFEVMGLKRVWIMALCTVIAIAGMLTFGYSQKWLNTTPESTSSNIFNNSTPNSASSQENSEITAMTSKSDTYTVKEYQGHIGVFYNDESIPYQEIDVDISALPQADRELLETGIKVTDENKLKGIIEDYES